MDHHLPILTFKQLNTMDQVDQIIAYESGELTDQEVVCFFADLVKSGMAWSLQGHYGRNASALIREGYIDREGNVSLAVLEL
jgi:hypothetical protein